MTEQQWPVPIGQNYYQLSFRIIERAGKTSHTTQTLAEAMRVASEAVRNVVWTGWSMFHQFTRKEIAPRIVIDRTTGDEVEAMQTDLRGETLIETTLPDFWRITADGRATLVRPYREDRETIPHLAKKGLVPGTWLSPRTLIRDVYEFVTYAKEFAKAYSYAESVEFRCSWIGLKGRQICDFEPGVDWRERTCHEDERTTAATVSVEQLAVDSVAVVEELTAPVLRLFDNLELGSEWIRSEAPKFRMHGLPLP